MKPITHKEVLDMLIAARKFVVSGWTKRSNHRGDPSLGTHKVCALGGIEAAMRKAENEPVNYGRPVPPQTVKDKERMEYGGVGVGYLSVPVPRSEYVAFEAELRLAAAIKNLTRNALNRPYRMQNIITAFNDHPDTTKADVLKAFDRAISRTRNRRPFRKVVSA